MKHKISAKEFLADVRAGLTDAGLMNKYDLSIPAVHSLFKKLVESGLMTKQELEERLPLAERSVSLEIFRCPACNMPQFMKFDECPQCGVIVKKLAAPSSAVAPAKPPEPGSAPPSRPGHAPQRGEPPSVITPPTPSQPSAASLHDSQPPDLRMPPDERSRPPSNAVKISVFVPVDMLNHLNGLGGDLSDHVTKAITTYLSGLQKSQMDR